MTVLERIGQAMKNPVSRFVVRGIIILGLLLMASCNRTSTPTTVPELPPVKTSALGFTVEGESYRFIGANAIYFGFYEQYGYSIDEAIRTAKEAGITVIRIYVWLGDSPWGGRSFREYDKVMDIAAQNGMYVIVTLTDCCPGDWGQTEESYFNYVPHCKITSESGVAAFKSRIEDILTRKNTINGRIYKDDTTILAWDIANELQLGYFSSSDLNKWLNEVVPYVKGLDPNHLVTIGIGDGNARFSDGPHPEAFNVPGLDFFSIHFYPKFQVGQQGANASDLTVIRSQTETYLSMGKPVVLEEFGVGSQRSLGDSADESTLDGWLKAYKDLMDTAYSAGASGAVFWGWGVPETRAVPLWWSDEDHDINETEFCSFIKGYQIPSQAMP